MIEQDSLANELINKDDNIEKLANLNKDLLAYTSKILNSIDIIADLFKNNDVKKANISFSQMVEGLEWLDKYIQIVAGEDNSILVDFKNVKELRSDFMLTVNDLLNFFKDKNYSLLANTMQNKLKKDIENFHLILKKIDNKK
jgi:hypothetical protein